METKFNFKSQPCTSREQAERLLKLGLKKETADMMHYRSSSMKEWGILATPWRDDCEDCKCYYPAWSLHRLIQMIADTDLQITHSVGVNIFDPFGKIIDGIDLFIKKGYFNKEYLVNQTEIEEHCKGVLEYLDYIRGEEE